MSHFLGQDYCNKGTHNVGIGLFQRNPLPELKGKHSRRLISELNGIYCKISFDNKDILPHFVKVRVPINISEVDADFQKEKFKSFMDDLVDRLRNDNSFRELSEMLSSIVESNDIKTQKEPNRFFPFYS